MAQQQQPTTTLNDPGDFMRSLDWSDPNAATGQLFANALKNQWSLDQLGGPMGFTGTDMSSHLQKYLTVPDAVKDFYKLDASGRVKQEGYRDPATGLLWSASYSNPNSESGVRSDLLGYHVQPQDTIVPGQFGTNFNPDGTFSQNVTYQDVKDNGLLMLALASAAMGFGIPALMGTSTGAGSLAAGAGLGEGLAAGGSLYTVPTAAEIAAGNAAFAESLAPYLAQGGAASGALYTVPTAAETAAANAAFAETLSPYLAPAAGGAAGTSLLSGISDKALGIGATVLGGALGSQGTPDQTQEKKMDPRMDQFVYGELMPKVQGLLTSQMPLAQQAGDQMRMVGSGLLGQPIAPNGFERFTRGRY